ncbi:MAG: hypothetical protein RI894_912 [Bacteroidota bacterium]|jgi:uncharacterized protein (TIRG00374 family)
MKDVFTNILKFVVFTAIGVGILYWVYTTQNEPYIAGLKATNSYHQGDTLLDKIVRDFQSVNLLWIGVTMLMFTISNLSRAYRWELLLHPLGFNPRTRNTYSAVMVAYLANLAISRIGEFVRCTYLYRFEKIPPTKLFGTVVVDRLLDVMCLLVAIAITFLLQFSKIWSFLHDNADFAAKLALINQPIVWVVCAIGLVGLASLYMQRARFAETAIYSKVRGMITGFLEGLKTIGQLEQKWVFLGHTVLIWVCYYLMTYFCFKSFAATENLGAVAALTVFVFGSMGIVVPSPGGMGSFHFLATAALLLYGVPNGDAFSFANIQFVTVNLCIIFFGIFAFAVTPFINRGYQPILPTEAAENLAIS